MRIGKSDIALQLLSRGHRLIADDAPLFYLSDNRLIGYCPEALQNLLEIRALGIVDIRRLFSHNVITLEKALTIIIELENNPNENKERGLPPKLDEKIIFDQPIPCLKLNLALSQNTAILIESAVQFALSKPFLEYSEGQIT